MATRYLEEIVLAARRRAACLPAVFEYPPEERRSLKDAIRGVKGRNAIIGELKYASPAIGPMGCQLDPVNLAKSMQAGGAIALSVLTEPDYFSGSSAFVQLARSHTPLPVMRKDFIVDERQVHETASLGADAILLIARVLGRESGRFVELSYALGMEPVVEVYSMEDTMIALETDAALIGINNRDLETMRVDISRTLELGSTLKEHGMTVISMSGIRMPSDIRRLRGCSDAFLIGTAIVRAPVPEGAVEEFVCA